MNLPNYSFRRDGLTWLAYCLLSYFSFMVSVFGPLMPFLRQDLDLNYAQGGLHLTALSIGMVLTGFFTGKLARKIGRSRVLWGGTAIVAGGALVMANAQNLGWSLPTALVMGFGGSSIQAVVQASLTERHKRWSATALTEANIGASLSSALAPFLVSGLLRLNLSWRFMEYFIAATALVLALIFARIVIPDAAAPEDRQTTSGKLPRRYWVFWGLVILFIAVEWSMVFWSTEFMISARGMSKVDAALVVGIFAGVGVLGRVISSQLTRRMPPLTILLIALGFCAAGFPLFWLSSLTWLSVAGLWLMNLGVANLFPLAMTLAVGSAEGHTDEASALISLATGAAGISAPLLLGWAADRLGSLGQAFGLVAIFLLVAIAYTLSIAWYLRRRSQSARLTHK